MISGRTGYDYKSVRRWTTQKKLGYGLLECDKVNEKILIFYFFFYLFANNSFKQIFVPIHKEIHWCLAVINKKEEKFQYLDSLGGADKKVMKMLVCFSLFFSLLFKRLKYPPLKVKYSFFKKNSILFLANRMHNRFQFLGQIPFLYLICVKRRKYPRNHV